MHLLIPDQWWPSVQRQGQCIEEKLLKNHYVAQRVWVKLTGVFIAFFLMWVRDLLHAAHQLIRKKKKRGHILFNNEAVPDCVSMGVFVGSHSETSRDMQKSHLFLFFICGESFAAFSEGLAQSVGWGGVGGSVRVVTVFRCSFESQLSSELTVHYNNGFAQKLKNLPFQADYSVLLASGFILNQYIVRYCHVVCF